MENINIRNANPRDAYMVNKIAKSVKLKSGNTKNGFLVYVRPTEEYKKEIVASRYFFIAEKNNKAIGFIMAYSKSDLKDFLRRLSYEDKTLSFLTKQTTKQFIFIDQLAVQPSFQRKGVGQDLLNKLKQQKIKNMFTCILHKPKQNKASLLFFVSKNNWKFIQDIEQDNYVWGIYKNK